jgi:hypothetical protein
LVEEAAVSGKRHKRGGRVTPKGTGALEGFTSDQRRGLAEIFAQVLRAARRELPADEEALVVELWASHLWSVFEGQELVGHDVLAMFGGGLISHAAAHPSAESRRVLRALAAVAPTPYGLRAAAAAERMTAFPDTPWAATLAEAVVPDEAWLGYDPVDDDGVNVMVGFDGARGHHTVGIYVDHNLGGMAKDAFVVPVTIAEVLAKLRTDDDSAEYRRVELAEAAARCRAAFEVTDLSWDPPVSDDLLHLRAVVAARLRALPGGGRAPVRDEVDEDGRDQLVSDFLASDEIVALVAAGRVEASAAELLAANIVTYALDYVEGALLRFSPVMVELFCCDWAPRKIAADVDTFAVLPDVLRAWIRFAGQRRGIPEAAIDDTVEAVDEHVEEMLEAAADPESWGPAKTVVQEMLAQGVDMDDEAAVESFIDRLNAEGGAGALV